MNLKHISTKNESEPLFFCTMVVFLFVCSVGFSSCFAFALFCFVMLREVINYDEQLLSENKTCKLQQRD